MNKKIIRNYQISCQAYGHDISNLNGTYIVKIKLDNVLDASYVKIKDPEEGLKIITELIQGFKFKVVPDLTIYDSKILGKIIVAEN